MIDGLVVVDKPSGWTSHDVVSRCRKIFGQKKIGHCGTLDPPATGVLLLGLGRATRLLKYLTSMDKSYSAYVVFGTTTSTLDDEGEITATFDMGEITIDQVTKVAKEMLGKTEQVPPMVSAIKINGQRLYELARQGIEIERKKRTIEIYDIKVHPTDEFNVFFIELSCSSGTYVRTIAADLGAKLGGGAHLRKLRRLRVGSFSETEAVPLEQLDISHVLSPLEMMRQYNQVIIEDPALIRAISHGRPLEPKELVPLGKPPWVLSDPRGNLLGVYEDSPNSDLARAGVVMISEDYEIIDSKGLA